MSKPIIRFKGFAKKVPKETLERLINFSVREDGEDFVVFEDDSCILEGPRDVVFTTHAPFELKPTKYDSIASEFVNNYLIAEFERNIKPPDKSIPLLADYGFKSELEEISLHFFFTPTKLLQEVLREKILPFMHDKFEARYVYPLKLESVYQQSRLSFVKIFHLMAIFDVERAKNFIFEKEALDSILPKGADFLSCIDALLVEHPFAVVMPLHRISSSLYFVREKTTPFPGIAANNIFEQFLFTQAPVAEMARRNSLFKGLGSKDTRLLFPLAIKAVNSFLRYLNDPRSFLNECTFNSAMSIQSYSLLRLLIADLLAINYSNSAYLKQKVAFSFLDKMSNFCCGRYDIKSSRAEVDVFKRLLSSETAEALAKILRYHARFENEKLANTLRRNILQINKDLHVCLGKMLDAGDDSEEKRLMLLRTLRNLSHGTFLHGQQFENNFYTGAPKVPNELVLWPLVLMWAFMLEPKRVLDLCTEDFR